MNKKQKTLLKAFILFYLVAFLAFNWNDVSWIFNYREISGLLDDFFNPYRDNYTSSAVLPVYAQNTNQTYQNNSGATYAYSEKNNILELPTLGVSVPIIISQNTDKATISKDLNKGVVLYPGSALPEQNGQTVILGHSAPLSWPRAGADWVFSGLNDLKYGDQVSVYLNHKKYTYSVKLKIILEQGQEITPGYLTSSTNTLVLVSCWPPGKNEQRIAVQAELN